MAQHRPGRPVLIKPVILAGAALLAVLAACDRSRPRPAATAAETAEAVNVAAPTMPLTFAQKTADGEVRLTLDPRIGAWPALHQRLYNETKRELGDFLQSAKLDRAKPSGDMQRLPYQREIAWDVTAETGRLVSLRQSWNEYTGGAHPNHGAAVLLWSKGGEAPVLSSALFRADTDYAPLDAALCAAAKGEKAARLSVAAAEAADWSCPRWKDSRAVLAPSTVKGKAGGLTFLFDPYVMGAYAEGDYEVTIPQSLFRPALAHTFVAEFAGDPATPARRPD